jgi:two-component system alkaline phosphatase synthesis response regulator PhoP
MDQAAKVLVIDDEPQTTTYFTTVLSDHGFSACAANSADEGLSQLETCRPDLILLDLVMPMKTGINLFNKIKRDDRYQDIPVVIVTGIRDEFVEDHKEFFDKLKLRKPAAYLEKPIDPDELIQTVKQSLGMNH